MANHNQLTANATGSDLSDLNAKLVQPYALGRFRALEAITGVHSNIQSSLSWITKLDDTFGWVRDLETNAASEPPQATVKAYADDPYSFDIPNILTVNFNQYIGETTPNQWGVVPLDAVVDAIKNNNRLMVQSGAGTGKSTMLKHLVHEGEFKPLEMSKDGQTGSGNVLIPNLDRLRSMGIERVLILEPTTSIGSQLAKDFKGDGLAVEYIDGTANQNDVVNAINRRVVICCFDSLERLEEQCNFISERTLVVVDECHMLVKDMSYRNRHKFRALHDSIFKAGRLVFLSATPYHPYCLSNSIHSNFGFRLLVGLASEQQEITIHPFAYSEGRVKDVLAYALGRFVGQKGDGLLCVKRDNVEELEIGTKVALRLGFKSDIFSSKEAKYKEKNANYKSLMATGRLEDDDIDILYFTSLLEAGVSIKDAVKAMVLIDTKSWAEVVQLMSRPRYNSKDGTNKRSNIHLFKKIKDDSENVPRSFESRLLEKTEQAKNMCKKLNSLKGGNYSYKVSTDDEKLYCLAKRRKDDTHEPCILGILWHLYEEEQKVSFDLMLKRVARFDSRVTITPVEEIGVSKNAEFEQHRAIIKRGKEQWQETVNELLYDQPLLMLAYLSSKAKNRDMKKVYKTVQGVEDVDKYRLGQFESEHCETLEHVDKTHRKSAIKLVKLAQSYPTKDLRHLARYICLDQDAFEYVDRLQLSERAYTSKVGEADKEDQYQLARLGVINRAITQYRQDVKRQKSKEYKTAKEWQLFLNRRLSKHKEFSKLKERETISLLRYMYETSERRLSVRGKGKRKQPKAYSVGHLKPLPKIDDVLKPYADQ